MGIAGFCKGFVGTARDLRGFCKGFGVGLFWKVRAARG